jgi:class 3 adenylate cyclase/DNA-binding NarL/FixJ family response regulator
MDGTILVVTKTPINTSEIGSFLADHEIGSFDIINADSLGAAEDIFFGGGGVDCIVVDFSFTEITALLAEMKLDEMFRHVPILAIIDDDDPEQANQVYDTGFDAHIARSLLDQLPRRIRPLIVNNTMNRSMMKKIGDLQEKAIRDFLLLDLIKDYIPKTIWNIARTFAHEQKISIPEEELDLTIVFADIKGFTALTQHMEPRQVVEILNTVFEVASRQIYEHHGDIDKFIGDAFFAVFEKAQDAVSAMVGMQRDLAALNAGRAEIGLKPVEFRVGIHSGPIIRGNVGGFDRFDNTLIGDTVNTASRLEQKAPAGGIMISEETRRRIGIEFPQSCRSSIELRGRDTDIVVYDAFETLESLPGPILSSV